MIEYENLRKLNEPFYKSYLEKFQAVLQTGWFILGDEVKAFEEEFAAYCGSKYCIGTANALDALTVALKALDFPAEGEVIVPSNTYIATILAILNARLTPVLVEPELATYNLDPAKIEEAISPKTVAVLVVHLYGKCCRMDRIGEICQRHDLKLIEDAAQAHGASFDGKKAGTFGALAAFSFYPTKNLGALGDGGCLTTDSIPLRNRVRMMRNYGSRKKYYNEVIGVNSRLDEIQAAFLRVKLKHLEQINAHKRSLAGIYNSRLKENFIRPDSDPRFNDVFHIYNIRHDRRDALRDYLQKNGVGSEIHYPVPPHRQEALKGLFGTDNFPIADEIHATTLSLPISFFHSEDDIGQVCEIMNRF